jgi:exodeoxyribonuclease VII large subunit
VPLLFQTIRGEAQAAVQSARVLTKSRLDAVHDRAVLDAGRSQAAIDQNLRAMGQLARRSLHEATTSSAAPFREIAGQGPEKTLGRGFALVRDAQGNIVTGVTQVTAGQPINLQFRDGSVTGRVNEQ